MSAELIKMTPTELHEASTYLGNKKSDILQAVGDLKNMVDTTTNNWAGLSQESFVGSFYELLPLLQEKFPEVIAAFMERFTKAAQVMEQTDLELSNAMGI